VSGSEDSGKELWGTWSVASESCVVGFSEVLRSSEQTSDAACTGENIARVIPKEEARARIEELTLEATGPHVKTRMEKDVVLGTYS
jgi:hypothetical protein